MDDELLPQSAEGIEGYGVDGDAVSSVLDGVGQSARALVDPPADQEVPQQGGSEPSGAHTPDPAGSTPAPATATPDILPGIPEPPPPPALTGDPQKDVEQNLLYHRALTEHRQALMSHQEQLTRQTAGVAAERARKEAEAEREAANKRAAEHQAYAQRRAERQALIDAAVKEKAAAAKDVEGADWMQRNTGAAIFATIAGALSAGLQNASAAQLGQVGHAENEGIKTIHFLMDREEKARRARVAQANDSLLQARYGFKDAADNHRAAMNDLDADMAAKYRLIAKEAEDRLRQSGADAAAIQGSLLRNEALAKASEYDGKIHDREETHQVARENAKAQQGIARASLAVRRDDAEDRAAARASEAARKAEQRDDETTVFDPRTGVKAGNAATKERAKEATNQLRDLNDVRGDISALKTHVLREGTVAPYGLTEESRTRETLAKNLVTRLASFKQLGAISKDDRVIVEGMMSGGVPAFLGVSAKQLDTLQKAVDRAEKNVLRSQGIGAEKPEEKPTEKPKAKPSEVPSKGFTAPGGVRYEMGADGNYHKVK